MTSATLDHRLRVGRALHERVRAHAENWPAVYRFTGPKGEVLYVGKSVRLRSRLLSYFRSDVPSKVTELLRVSTSLEWEYVPNGFEALLRELRHIRAFRPRFNRQHRRERRFAWVRVTGESAPRLQAARHPGTGNDETFGPFPAPRGLPAVLRELATETGLRDCAGGTPMYFADQAELFADPRKPRCSRAELGSCPGPCAGRCGASDYQTGVDRARNFLRGLDDSVLSSLRQRMDEAVARREFEQAARFRDRSVRLEELRNEIVFFRRFLSDLSFLYRVPTTPEGADWGYVIVEGRVAFSFPLGPTPPEGFEGNLAAHGRPAARGHHLGDGDREEIFLIARWFRWKPEERERTIPLDEIASRWHLCGPTCTQGR